MFYFLQVPFLQCFTIIKCHLLYLHKCSVCLIEGSICRIVKTLFSNHCCHFKYATFLTIYIYAGNLFDF